MRKAWLEARDYRVALVAATDVTSDIAAVLARLEAVLAA